MRKGCFSQGCKACRLWKKKLGAYQSKIKKDYQIVYTGIGGAVAGEVLANGTTIFGDGSKVYPRVGISWLRKNQNPVPKLVFAVASVLGCEELINLLAAAEDYKKSGVRIVIPVLTAFPHERQDHIFKAQSGIEINQLITLKGVVAALAGAYKLGVIDAAISIGTHSLRPVELSLRYGFPLLPIDAFEFMVSGAKLLSIRKPYVVGPDKGRYDVAARLARRLNCPYATAVKVREREKFGDPTVTIDPEALRFIKKSNSTVVVIDDEVREAGTAAAVREAVNGYTGRFVFAALKTIMARCSSGKETAVERLNKKLSPSFISERFYFANAIAPLIDTAPLNHKIKWIDMKPQIETMLNYLAHNMDKPEGQDGSGFYPGSLFSADLHFEKYS